MTTKTGDKVINGDTLAPSLSPIAAPKKRKHKRGGVGRKKDERPATRMYDSEFAALTGISRSTLRAWRHRKIKRAGVRWFTVKAPQGTIVLYSVPVWRRHLRLLAA